MSISRRQFFRGMAGHGEGRQREHDRRIRELNTYVRTNLLPYDFALTAEQTESVLAAVRARINLDGPDGVVSTEDLLSYERRRQMNEIVEDTVRPWREEYWKAEEVRRSASVLVQEFFAIEATPEDRLKLSQRFHVPSPAGPADLEGEIDRQVQSWLAGLSNAHMAACDGDALRELVFAELRSWC
jgi:hypothetical protein